MKSKLPKVCSSTTDHGYISPYFITNAKAQWIDFKKPSVLLSEKKISLPRYILPSLETIAQACCQLIIIAEDVDREALSACILNSGQQVIDTKGSIFSDNRKSVLNDFIIFTS